MRWHFLPRDNTDKWTKPACLGAGERWERKVERLGGEKEEEEEKDGEERGGGAFFFFLICFLTPLPLKKKINSYIPLTQHLVELRESSCAEMRGFKFAIEATPRLGSMAGQQNVSSPSTSHLWACFFY